MRLPVLWATSKAIGSARTGFRRFTRVSALTPSVGRKRARTTNCDVHDAIRNVRFTCAP